MTKRCYARVSSVTQKDDRQIDDLIRYGIDKKNIYVAKQSGKDFERKEYKKIFVDLKPNDLIVIRALTD